MKRKACLAIASAALAFALGGCSVEGWNGGTTVGDSGGEQRTAWESEFSRGKESLSSGYFGLALERFKAALSLNPESARVMNALAVTYDRLGRHDLAQLYYDRALAIDPNSATTLNNLGYSMLTRERYEEALIYFEQALKQRQVAAERRMTSANRQLALDRLRTVRQREEREIVIKASLAGAADAGRDGCQAYKTSAIGRSGARVFTLVTDPAARSAVQSGLAADCEYSWGPRVAMINTAVEAMPPVVAAPVTAVERTPSTLAEKPKSSAAPAADQTLRVEVSNGAGRNKLAARMRSYLEAKGLTVSYLTNAASFDNQSTAIFYKPGMRAEAEQFARQLPVSAELIEMDKYYAHIRVRLGRDMLDFDNNTLYVASRGAPDA
jgi:tetratricopeptide (TPR) repeat protein